MTKTNSKAQTKSSSFVRSLLIFLVAIGSVALFTYLMSFFSSKIIETVFKLLNFGIFCALAYWFFRTKQVPQAKEKIAQKQAELHGKMEENKTLLNLQKQVDLEIQEQDALAQKLYDQVKIWSTSFSDQKKALQSEQTELKKKAVVRAQQQAERKMSRAVSELVFERALHNAQKDLTQQFTQPQQAKKFNDVIFEFMRKEIQ